MKVRKKRTKKQMAAFTKFQTLGRLHSSRVALNDATRYYPELAEELEPAKKELDKAIKKLQERKP